MPEAYSRNSAQLRLARRILDITLWRLGFRGLGFRLQRLAGPSKISTKLITLVLIFQVFGEHFGPSKKLTNKTTKMLTKPSKMLTKVVKNLVKTMVFANLKNQHQTSKIRTKLVSLVRILMFWC